MCRALEASTSNVSQYMIGSCFAECTRMWPGTLPVWVSTHCILGASKLQRAWSFWRRNRQAINGYRKHTFSNLWRQNQFNQIVHGDLAARNVLVFKDNVVKIADFGLSKQLYGCSTYLMKRQVNHDAGVGLTLGSCYLALVTNLLIAAETTLEMVCHRASSIRRVLRGVRRLGFWCDCVGNINSWTDSIQGNHDR